MGLKSNLLGQSRESLPTGLYGVSKVNLCLPLRQGPNYLIEAENAGRIAPHPQPSILVSAQCGAGNRRVKQGYPG